MEFNKYQEGALETAQYPEVQVNPDKMVSSDDTVIANYVYPSLGLVGEAAEVAEKIKKIIRDKLGVWDDEDQDAIKKELGDVLWYIAILAHEFDIKLEDIATTNYEKLKSRKERNKIQGNGDDR